MGSYSPNPKAVDLPKSQTTSLKGQRQLWKAGVCLCSGSRVRAPNDKITPRPGLRGILLEQNQAMRGPRFCLPLGTCSVPREEQGQTATDSARSKTRTEPLLRSELRAWRVANRVSPPSSGLRSPSKARKVRSEQVAGYPAPRKETEWGKARLPAQPGLARIWGCLALTGSGQRKGDPAGGGWAGRGPLPIPRAQEDAGAQAGPTPGSRARRPRRAHQVATPAPDKGPGLGSPAGATSWPYPSRRAQPRRTGRDRGPEPAQTWRPVEGAPLPGRP